MAEQLQNSHWYRIKDIKLALRNHIRINQHEYRGVTWYILHDKVRGTHHRFNESAYNFIKMIDGERTINDIWQQLQDKHGDSALSQDEVVQLLGKLYFSDHLLSEHMPDIGELINRRNRERKQKFKSRFANPMSIRVPLLDPDKFLEKWMGLAKPLFTIQAAVICSLLLILAILQALQNWERLSNHFLDNALSSSNLLVLFMVYPLVKGLHELGHAFAVKRWGGEVHEMGIMLLVMMPVPYVDASASTAFRSKRKRMMVGGAGILVEVLLASVALLIWLNIQQGLVSDIMFNIMLIGGGSTLLFNGNPLLRFDGYYVLSDAIEIPGLGARSSRYYGYLVRRYLFGVKKPESPVSVDSERLWFIGYGAAAFIYRIMIAVAIIIFIAGKYFFIGVILAVWAIFMQLLLPVWKWLMYLFKSSELIQQRSQAYVVTLGVVITASLVLFLMPAPLTTITQGVVWIPEKSYIRAGGDGFVEQVLVKDGDTVRQGDELIVTNDPLLEDEIRLHQAKLKELQRKYDSLVQKDIVESEVIREEIKISIARLEHMNREISALTLTSPVDGVFVLPSASELQGSYIKQGDTVAYVIDHQTVSVRSVVPQSAIGLVRKHTEKVEIRLEGNIQKSVHSNITREIPAATYMLPSKALSVEGGGSIQTDPFDESGTRTRDQYFQFELSLPESIEHYYMGQRVHVRFLHGNETLAAQWYRAFEELFLNELG